MINKLFWKIFLSFWLAILLITSVAIWINAMVLHNLGVDDIPRDVQVRMERISERAVMRLSSNRSRTSPMRRARGARIYDAEGTRVSGPPLPLRLRHLKTVSERTEGAGFIAVPVERTDGTWRVVTTSWLPPRRFFGGPESAWWRLAVAGAVSALICWALARYLTRPIQRLRWASQRLAAGELATRVGAERDYGGDEIGQLSRDFDHMADRLQLSHDIQQQLLRDVSHELRSPLARLQMAVGLARRRLGSDSDQELDRIEAEADKLDELIGEILTLSREVHDDRPLDRTEVDVSELARLIVDDANFEAEQSERHIALSAPDQPLVLQADTRLLSRALENVVRNALAHSPPGGQVDVVLRADKTKLEIFVSDSGPGVPADQLEKIFKPFHRVDNARDRGTGGHGLGLAIARAAIERHGGRISANNADNGGLLVRIRLPLVSAPL